MAAEKTIFFENLRVNTLTDVNGNAFGADNAGGDVWEAVGNNTDDAGADPTEVIRPSDGEDRHLVFPASAVGTEGVLEVNIDANDPSPKITGKLMFDSTLAAFRVGVVADISEGGVSTFPGKDRWDEDVRGRFSAVVGGINNMAAAAESGTFGGINNQIFQSGGFSAIFGGSSNIIGNIGDVEFTLGSAIVGGTRNHIFQNGGRSVILGGDENVIGDVDGDADKLYAAVVGGGDNHIYQNGGHSVILGGELNVIGDVGGGAGYLYAAVLAGQSNTAEGADSVVMGNSCGTADGAIQSFAGGLWARANHPGSFVWGDGTNTIDEPLITPGGNQFLVRASGVQGDLTHSGVRFLSTPAAAGNVEPGVELERWASDWSSLHGKNSKTFEFVDEGEPADGSEYSGVEALTQLDKVPIYQFTYKGQEDVDGAGTKIHRIGPNAEDWYSPLKGNFPSVGRNSSRIGTMDMLGVALATIRELHTQVKDLRGRVETLEGA